MFMRLGPTEELVLVDGSRWYLSPSDMFQCAVSCALFLVDKRDKAEQAFQEL